MQKASNKDLIAQLKSERKRDRRNAARQLGKRHVIEAVPALVERLRDGYASVQESAALALGEIRDPATIPVLTDMFRGGNYGSMEQDGAPHRFHRILGSAGIALSRFGTVEAVEPLYADFTTSLGSQRVDDVTLSMQAECVSYAGGERAYNLLFPLWTERKYNNMRPLLAVCLGRCGVEQASSELVLALGSRSVFLRAAAAEGLGLLGDKAAALPLMFRLMNAEAGLDETTTPYHRTLVSIKIAQALGLLKTFAAVAALKGALWMTERRFAAAVGLAYAQDGAALDILLPYTTSKDHRQAGLKTIALEALAALDNPAALSALKTFADEHEFSGLDNYPAIEEAIDRWTGVV